MINKANLIGRLGKDPELKKTPSGVSVCNFSIATSERYTDKSGEKQESTEWHNIVVWQKLADVCGQYLKKGSLVYIEGKIQTRSWDKEDGTKAYMTEIVAKELKMLDKKPENNNTGNGFQQQQQGGGFQQSPPVQQQNSSGFNPQNNNGFGQVS